MARTLQLVLFIAFGLVLAVPGSTARRETGFLNRTVTVEGRAHRYQVYVPAEYAPQKLWPVLLFLHGSGERGTDGLLQTEIGLGTALRRHSEHYPVIAVFPQALPDTRWPGTSARIALAALEATQREFRCDRDRVYLTGLSMGGNGVWYLAYRNPGRWAAALVACGWVTPDERHPTAEPVVPPADGPAAVALGRKIRALPVWLYHGARDDVIAPSNSRDLAAALDSLGAPARYTELPDVGHGSWDAMYSSPEVASWLLSQRRAPR